MIASEEIHRLWEDMYQFARPDPGYLLVSLEDRRRIWLAVQVGSLNRALLMPKRPIRKVHLRKVYARRRAGRKHIQRLTQAYDAREQVEMERLKESPS